MEAPRILERPATITWDYDEARKEVVGLTLIGLRARLLQSLAANH